jgi:hypothetical protein
MILDDMKSLLCYLPGLRRLELIDLELDGHDASHVLDEVSEICSFSITELKLVNTSRRPFSLLAVASFVNLRNLEISPHNLGDDLVECIGEERVFESEVNKKGDFLRNCLSSIQATCPGSAT